MSYHDQISALHPLMHGLKRECEKIAHQADAELTALRTERDELRALLTEARDCVAESLDAAVAAPSPREARIQYHRELLAKIDKARGVGV